ncbi:MAG TPA: hypothetical protein VFO55_12970 [Gemmatimonadaceae bacterium]|nr:hypothetical protein [Gemmatimonadaceae bacterium]
MLGALLILTQIAASAPAADSLYATPALRTTIERAAATNRIVPPALAGYTAHLETEMALIIVDTLGRERTGQVEQMGGLARWDAENGFQAHIGGYRTQSTGVPISMAGLIRNWSIPMLYGQRLLLGLDFSTPPEEQPARVGQRRDTLRAVHPFATDRERYYRYTGGDTVGFLQTIARRVPIVRIYARPNLGLDANFAAFDGEVDIDADRQEIVRMRGRFVVSERMSRYRGITGVIVKASGAVAVAYVEFTNAEHNGRYWLPATQRVELQTTSVIANGLRFTFRVISKFTDYDIREVAGATADRFVSPRRRTTFAPSDSLERFRDWRSEMGSASSSLSATDFDDIAPPQWRGDGPPRLRLFPSRFDRVLHFNRIEGVYTGVDATLEFRSLSPGTVARANVGWAWSEKTVRGGLGLSRAWSRSSSALVAERRLAPTQDFQRDFAGLGSGLGAFLGSIEEADWVDRRAVTLSHVRIIQSLDHALTTLRLSAAHDKDVAASLTRGPIVRSREFLPNRHAATGSYALAGLGYEFHPNVTGELLQPGIGATFSVEAAEGELSWIRAEGSASARRYLGPVTLASRVDAGVVHSAAPPPQTLFELGGISGRLDGYEYKEFAGDRAAVGRVYAAYGFPILRAPRRAGRYLIPGLSPGMAVGADAGWAELSSPAAHAAVLAMGDGTEANAVSRETGRVRSTVSASLTFFSNSLHVGVARPVDHPAPWRWFVRLGQGF